VNVSFKDVAGIDEAVEEVRDLVTFLKNPKGSGSLGGRMPKGILLVGPPGNGKTLLARAVAGEAGVPFFSADASSFVEMFVGVGAGRVRDLFEDAKKHAPCIIFIDELDAIGKKRGGMASGGGNDEREQTLNQLLIAMDGFSANEGIILMAATNRPETLDGALTRSGRLDRQVVVPRPDLRGREKILKIHSRDKLVAPDVDYTIVARRTTGMSGADLEAVMNEAALRASKLNKPAIELADIEFACKKIQLGAERTSAVIPEETKRVIAVHECGHTLAGWFTVAADQIREVTIVPRGPALGLTWTMPDEDRVLLSKTQLLAEIQLLYGGRVAEQVVFGAEHVTTGASNDLERLSKIAKGMVKHYGMCPELGPPQVFGETETGFVFQESRKDYSDETEAALDKQVNSLLKGCYDKVLNLLTEKRELLDKLTAALIDKESLGQAEIEAILGPRKPLLA
jgi:cell division protease FtsH